MGQPASVKHPSVQRRYLFFLAWSSFKVELCAQRRSEISYVCRHAHPSRTHANYLPQGLGIPTSFSFQICVCQLSHLQEPTHCIHSNFLPFREEYNDYMSWCASYFQQDIQYVRETVCVSPIENRKGPIQSWQVISRNVETKEAASLRGMWLLL